MNEVQYILGLVIQEATEVAHRASKAQLYGLTETQEGQNKNNVERLTEELLDLFVVLELLAEVAPNDTKGTLVDEGLNTTYVVAKREKIQKYMAYARSIGTLS